MGSIQYINPYHTCSSKRTSDSGAELAHLLNPPAEHTESSITSSFQSTTQQRSVAAGIVDDVEHRLAPHVPPQLVGGQRRPEQRRPRSRRRRCASSYSWIRNSSRNSRSRSARFSEICPSVVSQRTLTAKRGGPNHSQLVSFQINQSYFNCHNKS